MKHAYHAIRALQGRLPPHTARNGLRAEQASPTPPRVMTQLRRPNITITSPMGWICRRAMAAMRLGSMLGGFGACEASLQHMSAYMNDKRLKGSIHTIRCPSTCWHALRHNATACAPVPAARTRCLRGGTAPALTLQGNAHSACEGRTGMGCRVLDAPRLVRGHSGRQWCAGACVTGQHQPAASPRQATLFCRVADPHAPPRAPQLEKPPLHAQRWLRPHGLDVFHQRRLHAGPRRPPARASAACLWARRARSTVAAVICGAVRAAVVNCQNDNCPLG